MAVSKLLSVFLLQNFLFVSFATTVYTTTSDAATYTPQMTATSHSTATSTPTATFTFSTPTATPTATFTFSTPATAIPTATFAILSPTVQAADKRDDTIIAATVIVGSVLLATAVVVVAIAIGVITKKKRQMYNLTVKPVSEIEMRAISNAMYGKMESHANSKPVSLHCETDMNESKSSDYALPCEIRGVAFKSSPIAVPTSSKKLSTKYFELEEAICTSPIVPLDDDYKYSEVHESMISARSPGHQAVSSVRSPGHQAVSSVRPQVLSHNMGDLGPQERGFLEPPPDEMKLYEQFNSMDLKVLTRDSVKVLCYLGSGQFGTVDKGEWQSHLGLKQVAIKTLNPGTEDDNKVKFLQEAAIMGQFSHPNVVKLYGIITDGEPKMMILELLNKGDLKKYVTSLRPSNTDVPPSNLAARLLLACAQISSGMCYLANKGFVHRDLAARNILVSEDDQCKIADFGMSRDLANENYYISHGGKIPVKWTAPEAIYYKKYSTASDVWSFGCVLYEIWSLGEKPFETYSAADTMRLVDSGYRLPPPPGCPRGVYDLMVQCWHPSGAQRPAFVTLCRALYLTKDTLLRWSSEDMGTHPQAAVLGAPLECGEKLYVDLQKKYCHFRTSFV